MQRRRKPDRDRGELQGYGEVYASPPAERLKAERVQLRMSALPGWKLSPSHERITRRVRFASPESAASFVGLVVWLSRGRDHYPEVRVRRERLFLSLTTKGDAGLTERDFALAEAISREL